jgi:hypothetical protein
LRFELGLFSTGFTLFCIIQFCHEIRNFSATDLLDCKELWALGKVDKCCQDLSFLVLIGLKVSLRLDYDLFVNLNVLLEVYFFYLLQGFIK